LGKHFFQNGNAYIMKQLFQNLKTGETYLEDVPVPKPDVNEIVIQSAYSLVSLGTERMLVEFGKAGLLDKAKQQPEKVKMVIEKIRSDGLGPTLRAVRSKLDNPLPLGYCNAGKVVEIGSRIDEFKVGDYVVTNGPHSEFVSVPTNLAAKLPENVSLSQAPFAVIGAIGLQGLRLINPTLGETIVVFGLGLVGQLTAQLAAAHGCKVIGIDIQNDKIDLLKGIGLKAICAEHGNLEHSILQMTEGVGADAVVITASAKNDSIVSQSAKMCRKKGRIVLVGVTDLHLNRADFYEKEISFQVSCSYGPGRYDPMYEQHNIDYPVAFVRWTEKRNFEAVLNCFSNGTIRTDYLNPSIHEFEKAPLIYEKLSEQKSSAVLLKYSDTTDFKQKKIQNDHAQSSAARFQVTSQNIGIAGVGVFARSILLPALSATRAQLEVICSKKGASAAQAAKKFNIASATTSFEEVLASQTVGAVVIATRNNLHAEMVKSGLESNKHVFVEKPLCLTRDELNEICDIYRTRQGNKSLTITVGFNRRFSSLAQKAREILGQGKIPMSVSMTINTGLIPKTHWTRDPIFSGGRIIGEACHFMDLFVYLCGSKIATICATPLSADEETVIITMKSENGSICSLQYFTNGNSKYPKEKVDVFSGGKIVTIDNFKIMYGYGFKGFTKLKTKGQDKGHKKEMSQWIENCVSKGAPIIDFEEILNVTKASFAAADSLKNGGQPINVENV